LPSTTRPDDLAAVIRDAAVSHPDAAINETELLDATRNFISALDKNHIPHALVGGLALLQHVEGRNTRDIALIIALEDLERLPGFELDERNEWFGSGHSGPLRVDLLFTTNPLFKEIAERHAEERNFLGARLRCATPEGIVLLKLFALPSLYRQGQIDRATLYETDILMLLRHYPIDDDILLSQLEPHISTSHPSKLNDLLSGIRKRISTKREFQQ
jgi:hypothetical protein